ncbi:hypothetical protein ACIO93_34640 [Streptomyces sp. NPDC087903]|uniref:hypothetical protein n=1 Tax=Streptomyces sp. NPDC087903 TaxID=3365819 RepID=UPI00382D927E
MTTYQLPPYAPELNPVDGVWSHLRRSLDNLTEQDLVQPTALVKTRLRRCGTAPARLRDSSPKPGPTSNLRRLGKDPRSRRPPGRGPP